MFFFLDANVNDGVPQQEQQVLVEVQTRAEPRGEAQQEAPQNIVAEAQRNEPQAEQDDHQDLIEAVQALRNAVQREMRRSELQQQVRSELQNQRDMLVNLREQQSQLRSEIHQQIRLDAEQRSAQLENEQRAESLQQQHQREARPIILEELRSGEQRAESLQQHQRVVDARPRPIILQELRSVAPQQNITFFEDQNTFIYRMRTHIDEFLANDPEQRGLVINPQIVGWAYGSHPYMVMASEDRSRLNRIRIEIERIQNEIEFGPVRHNEYAICVVCFDDIRNISKTFSLLVCGHVHCQPCIDNIIAVNRERRVQALREGYAEVIMNACGFCRREFEADSHRRIFFNYRD